MLVSVTKDLTKKLPARDLVREIGPIIGGGGGGRPDLAEAGGKSPVKLHWEHVHRFDFDAGTRRVSLAEPNVALVPRAGVPVTPGPEAGQ